MEQRVRVDKWLWAARFFKTRALASRACDLGRVEINAAAIKASRELRLGDVLRVRTEAGEYEIEVLQLSTLRGPASVAQSLYRETDASREARERMAEERKMAYRVNQLPEGRPSKRDRREIDRFRGRS